MSEEMIWNEDAGPLEEGMVVELRGFLKEKRKELGGHLIAKGAPELFWVSSYHEDDEGKSVLYFRKARKQLTHHGVGEGDAGLPHMRPFKGIYHGYVYLQVWGEYAPARQELSFMGDVEEAIGSECFEFRYVQGDLDKELSVQEAVTFLETRLKYFTVRGVPYRLERVPELSTGTTLRLKVLRSVDWAS